MFRIYQIDTYIYNACDCMVILERYTIKFYEYILITIVNILVYRVSATRVDFAIVFLAILLHIIVSNGIVIRQLKVIIDLF